MPKADPTKLKLVKDLRSPGIAMGLALAPKSQRAYVGCSDFQVHALDFADKKPKAEAFAGPGHESYVTSLALAGERLISGSYDGRLIWWDVKERKSIRRVEGHKLWIRRIALSPDGKLVASVADDMICRLWNTGTGEKVREFAGHKTVTPNSYPSMLYAVAFSPDGKHLATGDKAGYVIVWDVATGKQVKTLQTPVMYTWDPRARRHSIGGIRSLAFSPDGKQLAVGGMGKVGNIDHLQGDSRVEVFDWRAGKRLREISDGKRKGLVEQIVYHTDGGWFLAAGGDHKGFLTIYDSKTGKCLNSVAGKDHVHAVAFNADCTELYAAHHSAVSRWQLGG